ncbi:hypothetical protein ABOX97_32250, partial [Pseudomonas aeruginosa]
DCPGLCAAAWSGRPGPAGVQCRFPESRSGSCQRLADPTGEIIVRLAKALGVSTDELLLTEQERTVSEDLAPILRRFDALPPDIRNQARIALKGVLFGYEQEALR